MKSKVRRAMVAYGLGIVAIGAGCAMQEKQTMQGLTQPINCATAEGDIRVLQSEKAHAGQQIASGVAAISPAGFVLGALTGTEGTKLQVASGDYNDQIDMRIAAIKATCRIP